MRKNILKVVEAVLVKNCITKGGRSYIRKSGRAILEEVEAGLEEIKKSCISRSKSRIRRGWGELH